MSLKLKICGVFAIIAATTIVLVTYCAAAKGIGSSDSGTKSDTTALVPGPNDSRIAYQTARLLEDNHYLQEPLDENISEKFFDQYIEMLDGRRENFLQSDIDEFAQYRTNMGAYTVGGHGRSDLTPAYVIFDRFKQRLVEHTAYVDALLKDDHFNFDTDERRMIDRRNAPWPKTMAEAQTLWRQELMGDFLSERLGREISPTNIAEILPLSKSANAEIADKLSHHYDWQTRAITNWDSDTILQTYLEALMHAYDPHSDYFNQEGSQSFKISMGLSLTGIGAQLKEEEGYCTIDSLLAGGPAKLSGKIHAGDRIVAVAQSNEPPVNVVDMDLGKVVEMIRGPKGTQVRLTITPADQPTVQRPVVLTRDEIKLADQHAHAELVETSDGKGGTNRIGIITLPSFYASMDASDDASASFTTVDVAKLIRKLEEENVSGIIVDLRNNPGGSLEEAVSFTGLFIKSGPVVLARDPDGQVGVYPDGDPAQLYSGPLVVMVDRLSASAAEIAAAALQDYGRALVVGDTSTFGKGTVQELQPLRPLVMPATPTATNDPGTAKITIRKFYRVTGASTQFKGVVPDIIIPDVLSYSAEIGETNLENPLPWDTIHSVPFDMLNLVAPYLEQLRKNSAARVATNQDFLYVRQDIDQFKKLQADPTESLNEKAALQKIQQNTERNYARDAEIALRPVPDQTTYAISLDNAETNGLPQPESFLTTNFNAALIATNANGTVMAWSTNQDLVIGVKMSGQTNPAVANVITRPGPDAMLEETEKIMADYISLSSNHILIAQP